jgi:hypothetical protein
MLPAKGTIKMFAPQGKMACAAGKNGLRDQAK